MKELKKICVVWNWIMEKIRVFIGYKNDKFRVQNEKRV